MQHITKIDKNKVSKCKKKKSEKKSHVHPNILCSHTKFHGKINFLWPV
jgi:hypothetical protein